MLSCCTVEASYGDCAWRYTQCRDARQSTARSTTPLLPHPFSYVLPEHIWIPIVPDIPDVDKPVGVLVAKIKSATDVRNILIRICSGAGIRS